MKKAKLSHLFAKDSLQRKIEELAGPDAVSCGIHPYVGPSEEIDACLAAAVRSGRTAWMRYDQTINPSSIQSSEYLAGAKILKPSGTSEDLPSYFLSYRRSIRFGIRQDKSLTVDPAMCNVYDLKDPGIVMISCG